MGLIWDLLAQPAAGHVLAHTNLRRDLIKATGARDDPHFGQGYAARPCDEGNTKRRAVALQANLIILVAIISKSRCFGGAKRGAHLDWWVGCSPRLGAAVCRIPTPTEQIAPHTLAPGLPSSLWLDRWCTRRAYMKRVETSAAGAPSHAAWGGYFSLWRRNLT